MLRLKFKSLVLFACIAVIGANLHAMYDPTVGRFVQRDPIDEKGFQLLHGISGDGIKGTVDPYTFVQNNPISFFDWLGLWKKLGTISNGSRMLYQMESGDTNAGLAKLVRLDENEFDKWAKWEDQAKLDNPSESEKKKRHCGYSVPNVIYLMDLTAIPMWNSWLMGEIRILKNEGYKTVEINDPTRDKALKALSQNNLYGFLWLGHGDKDKKGYLLASDDRLIAAANVKSSIKYKLGFVKILSCYSATRKSEWQTLVSPYGYFYIKNEGLLWAFESIWASHGSK